MQESITFHIEQNDCFGTLATATPNRRLPQVYRTPAGFKGTVPLARSTRLKTPDWVFTSSTP
jgi:hypothetical protein